MANTNEDIKYISNIAPAIWLSSAQPLHFSVIAIKYFLVICLLIKMTSFPSISQFLLKRRISNEHAPRTGGSHRRPTFHNASDAFRENTVSKL